MTKCITFGGHFRFKYAKSKQIGFRLGLEHLLLMKGKVRKIGMHYFFLTGDIEGHSLGSLRSFYGSDDNPQKYQSDRLRPTTSLPRGLSSSLHQV